MHFKMMNEYDVVTGWPSGDMVRAHEEEGRRLHEQVVAALPEDIVDFHYWETNVVDR